MAIKYIRKRQRVNHNGEVRECYVAKVAYGSTVGTDLLAQEISRGNSMSEADVLGMLRALEHAISGHLAEGDMVKLDSLGTFYPTIHATTQTSPEAVSASTIQRVGVLFRPTVRFKQKLKEAGLRLADDRLFVADSHPNGKSE